MLGCGLFHPLGLQGYYPFFAFDWLRDPVEGQKYKLLKGGNESRIFTYAKFLQHVIRVDLNSTHVKLNRTNVLVDLALVVHWRHLQLRSLLARAVLFILRLELFEYLDLFRQESLRIGGLDFDFRPVGVVAVGVGDCSIPLGVLNSLFKHRHGTRAIISLCILVPWRRIRGLVKRLRSVLNLDGPGGRSTLHIEPFTYDPNLAPGIPVGRDQDLIPVDHIVL